MMRLPQNLGALLLLAAAGGVLAQAFEGPFYLEVSPTSSGDLERLFEALEASVDEELARKEPVVVVLHGEEALAFTRTHYEAHKRLADRAAILQAHGFVDLRMCETWMRRHGIQRSDLLPFVGTVPYAPEEIRRLRAQGYLAHPSVQI